VRAGDDFTLSELPECIGRYRLEGVLDQSGSGI
jgi:hypothetical protein